MLVHFCDRFWRGGGRSIRGRRRRGVDCIDLSRFSITALDRCAAYLGSVDFAAACTRSTGAMVEANGWNYDEAVDWFNFNTLGAYMMGEATPLFVNVLIRE
jgi:hypothetical protein